MSQSCLIHCRMEVRLSPDATRTRPACAPQPWRRRAGACWLSWCLGFFLFLLALSLLETSASADATNRILTVQAREPIRPIPQSVALNPEKVALGRRLFHDPQL